jgi:hypothetical protein
MGAVLAVVLGPLPKDDLNEVDLTKCVTKLTIVGARIPSAMTTRNHGYGLRRRRGGRPTPHGVPPT